MLEVDEAIVGTLKNQQERPNKACPEVRRKHQATTQMLGRGMPHMCPITWLEQTTRRCRGTRYQESNKAGNRVTPDMHSTGTGLSIVTALLATC